MNLKTHLVVAFAGVVVAAGLIFGNYYLPELRAASAADAASEVSTEEGGDGTESVPNTQSAHAGTAPSDSSSVPTAASAQAISPNYPNCRGTGDCRIDEVCGAGLCKPDWWCMCYRERDETGGVIESTGCRQGRETCQNLEKAAVKGGKILVENGVVRSCQQVAGEHPGDTLGGRAGWLPSKRAGSWQVLGRCVLR